MFCTIKKVNVNIFALFRFTYSIAVCVGLHCTRTTEEVAFGIMMCTHSSSELFSKTGRRKTGKQNSYMQHKTENAEEIWEQAKLVWLSIYRALTITRLDNRFVEEKNHCHLINLLKDDKLISEKKLGCEMCSIVRWYFFFDKAFWETCCRYAWQINRNLPLKEARLVLGIYEGKDFQ